MLTIEKFKFTPILGWSLSRYDVFKTCKRQYYYQYYGKYDSKYPREKIESLKHLTSIPLEIGNISHKTISAVLKRLLKSKKEIDRLRFQDFVKKSTVKNCEKKTFFEVYYNEMEMVIADDVLPAIQSSLNNFLESPRLNWIRDKALVAGQQWLIEPEGYGEARIDGMKVYCKVDFLFLVDDRVVILDWKTGKRNKKKHEKQMLGYCTWAGDYLKTSTDNIDAFISYLRPSYEEERVTPKKGDLDQFKSQIRRETDEMYAFCTDIQENVPFQKTSFQMISQSIICSYCNYKELCNRI